MRPFISTAAAVLMMCPAAAQEITIDTYVGPISYVDQTLTKDSARALQRTMDLQRTSQLVMWSYPMVQFTKALAAVYDNLGKARTETPIGLFSGYDGVYPFFTPNLAVPYTIGALDLSQTGPVVLKTPKGPIYGVANDLWQQPIKEIGSGEAETVLFVGPGQDAPADFDGEIVRSPTYGILWFFRVVGTGPEAEGLSEKVRIYPLAAADNPPPTEITPFDPANVDHVVTNAPPTDMGYWDIVNAYVQREPLADRDRFFYAWLANLGIEKGKPFRPTDAQREILMEGLKVGLAMAQANSFNKRFAGAQYGSSDWHDVLAGMDPAIDLPTRSLFDERASYTFEASTTSSGMTTREVGVGSAYLSAYYDSQGRVLQGAHSYRLHLAPDVPAGNFWAITVYDAANKLLIRNDERRSEINSRMPDLVVNGDGSVDLFFGPTKPQGKAANWIQTNPGQSFFMYFRAYAPLKPFRDETWPMNPLERID